jgi:hypothetical protein
MEYKILSFKKSLDKKHKYVVVLLNLETNKEYTVKFGAYGMNDYIIYSKNDDPDKEKYKKNYLNRHRKREDWDDLTTAGAWSRWILWSKPTLNESLYYMIKRYKIKI